METIESVEPLRARVAAWRREGRSVAFVPTMGNLHEGHLGLVDLARERCDRVVCSIYVNPTQFGPSEDYARYPRTLDSDRAALRARAVDALFVPDNRVVYPFGEQRATWVEVPGLSDVLCGAFRPGHFRGVTSVVCRLLNMVQPDCAVFGEKDYQQLLLIRRMVRDLAIPVAIVGGPTRREADGLAMSSRNQYLSAEERSRAPALYRELCAVRGAIASGARDYAALERTAAAALDGAGFRTEYVAVRAADTLELPAEGDAELRVLAAAWLGRARLIDNVSATAARG